MNVTINIEEVAAALAADYTNNEHWFEDYGYVGENPDSIKDEEGNYIEEAQKVYDKKYDELYSFLKHSAVIKRKSSKDDSIVSLFLMYKDKEGRESPFVTKIYSQAFPSYKSPNIGDKIKMGTYLTPKAEDFFGSAKHISEFDPTKDHDFYEIINIVEDDLFWESLPDKAMEGLLYKFFGKHQERRKKERELRKSNSK